MKKTRISIMAIALVLTSFISSYAQTADEIVQKHITAIGGAENWKKLTSMKVTGTMNAGGQELPIIITIVHKKGFKVEYTINGMTGYSIVTDKAGWNFNPFMGQTKPDAVPEEQVKEMQSELDLQGELIDYQAKGNKIEYLGKDDVEGTECHKLKLTHSNGKAETMYFDISSFYHIKSVTKMKANGQEMDAVSAYGNFQKLPEGIVFPMSVDDGGGAVTVKAVEINKPIDMNVFKPAEETKK